MRGAVMKIPFETEKLLELTQELYSSFFTPQYMFRKVLSVRTYDDAKFLMYSAWKLIGHLLDFDKNQTKVKMTSPKFWINAVKSLFTHLKHKKDDERVDEMIKESAKEELRVKANVGAKI